MTLQILISTIDSGIEKVKDVLLPIRDDVSYIVSHQYQHNEFKYTPPELNRPDISLSHIYGRGISKSRNHAISLATGDICLICDDDVRYTNEYINTIIYIFQKKKPDVALFKIKTGNGESEYKNYPPYEYKLEIDKMHWPSSIEIAFRTQSIKNMIFFDERFGLGTALVGGEEYFFIRDSIEKDLNVHYYPFYIVGHSLESTNKSLHKYDRKKIMGRGAADARINGWFSLIKTALLTLRLLPNLLKNRRNPFVYLVHRFKGNLYILKS